MLKEADLLQTKMMLTNLSTAVKAGAEAAGHKLTPKEHYEKTMEIYNNMLVGSYYAKEKVAADKPYAGLELVWPEDDNAK